MEDECIFCRIVSKELPASIVHEDDEVMAFMDVGAATKGHTLVIPKKHVKTVFELDAGTASAVFTAATRISKALRKAVKCDGLNLLVANEEAAGQVVFHLHVHLIPRYAGDDFGMEFRYKNPPREELDETAAEIRDAMGA
jgi:diadenosine tetraphosphate (Ap4A) HIT family hydrolase